MTPSIPKPGPKPGAHIKPSALARPNSSRPAVHASTDDPHKWGRVDEQGQVFLILDDEERLIGSWQAGTPEEGLAHYAARFDDLNTEVELLESRLNNHPQESAHIKEKAQEIYEKLDSAAVIGDLNNVKSRVKTIIDSADSVGEQAKQQQQRRRQEAIAQKEALIAEAEELAQNSTDWKNAGDRIRDILEEWKTIRGIDRKTNDELWRRYSRARDAFNRRRGAHFAELDRGRAAARKAKEEIVEKAQQLENSTDWNETADKFRQLMAEWKKAGRAPRDVDDKLWAAFKSAQDHFFAARNAKNDERDREFAENASAKEKLLQEYDALIDPQTDINAARTHLQKLQEQWDSIGFVPRNRVREFEEKISALEARVSEAEKAQWRRTDPETQARVAQFNAKVEQLTKQAQTAEEKGNDKKAAELRAQAAQWQEWADAANKAVNEL
ncbi:DUF349 domain-containing protein [Corynebacterium sp. sy039]|uniref:DUF349 domain-containing protein n=1 Tax=Corynebacterium sp. sy039 TaxID=2599641 RepID=UPI0011B7A718|nr:DUF349 domain-containing protein [Corynebacterium sp. sy039]QDZ42767.1 DUF349 domain-containing protein [Corynebacterium sp. sy039]